MNTNAWESPKKLAKLSKNAIDSLEQWRGTSLQKFRFHRKEKSSAEAIDKLLFNLKLQQRPSLETIQKAWQKIVGADLAKVSEPKFLRQGLLSISVVHPLIRTELEQNFSQQLLPKLQKNFPGLIKRIKFNVG